MEEAQNAVYEKRVHIILAIMCVISFYFTGFINILILPDVSGISIRNLIYAFFHSSSTFGLFPGSFGLCCIIGAYIVHKSWLAEQNEDKMGRDVRYSDKLSPYGDAHYMEPWEFSPIAQIRPVDRCKGKVLGQIGSDGSECIDFNPYDGRLNSHMLAIGQSGGGKTYTFVKPFMYQAVKQRHSLVLTDPDGGLYEDTAGYFRDNGYIVRKLDLKNLKKSDGWDCLSSLEGENFTTNVMIFSKTVVSNISDNEDIYSTASQSLLSALVLRVMLGDDYPPEAKNIKSVYELLQNPAGLEFLETMFDKTSLNEEALPCLAPYMAFKQASDRLAANIATHLANGLQLLQNDLLCRVLSTDDIDLTLPGKELCVYYCQFPDSHNTFKFIVSLFFSMIFICLTDYADLHTKKRRLPIPVDFLLDEFPSIGIIPDWSTKISVLRKRAINCIMIIQDLTQLQQRYKETWNTIINNCGTIITLGVNEPNVTAKWISERIGDASIEVESTSEAQIIGRRADLTTRSSKGVGKRALISSAEVCKIIRDGSLILFANNNPIYARKTPHTIFKDSKRLYTIKPENVLDIDDVKGRKLLHECEDKYREEFWSTHEKFPDLHVSDLSDAKYLEPPSSPLNMFFSVIKNDFKHIYHFIKCNILHKKEVKTTEDTEKANLDNSVIADLAEKGAFNEYYKEFLEAQNMPTDFLPVIEEDEKPADNKEDDDTPDKPKFNLFKHPKKSNPKEDCKKADTADSDKPEEAAPAQETLPVVVPTVSTVHSNVHIGNFGSTPSFSMEDIDNILDNDDIEDEDDADSKENFDLSIDIPDNISKSASTEPFQPDDADDLPFGFDDDDEEDKELTKAKVENANVTTFETSEPVPAHKPTGASESLSKKDSSSFTPKDVKSDTGATGGSSNASEDTAPKVKKKAPPVNNTMFQESLENKVAAPTQHNSVQQDKKFSVTVVERQPQEKKKHSSKPAPKVSSKSVTQQDGSVVKSDKPENKVSKDNMPKTTQIPPHGNSQQNKPNKGKAKPNSHSKPEGIAKGYNSMFGNK